MSDTAGPIVFLHRHRCGHYAVELGTSRLAAGFHANVGVRVSTTDEDCLTCEVRPALHAEAPLRQLADNRLTHRLHVLACHERH